MSKIRNLTNSFSQSVQSLKKAAVNSYADFINNINKGYGAGESKNANKSVGEITISSNNSNAIYMFSTKNELRETFIELARKSLENILGDIEGFGEGKGEYKGLYIQHVKSNNLNIDLVHVSAVDEAFVVDEIINCDLTNYENLRKIFIDLNDLFRGYQEMTIDAAKKLYAIMALFYSNFMKAMSTLHLDHNFSKFTGEDNFIFEIVRNSKFAVDGKLGEYKEVFNDEGKLIAIAFVDIIGDVQNSVIADVNETMQYFNSEYRKIEVPEDIRTSWNGVETNKLISDVIAYVKNPYGNLTKWRMDEQKAVQDLLDAHAISKFNANIRLEGIKTAFKEELNKITATARILFKDTDMVQAGFLMFAASHLTKWRSDGFGGITRSTVGLYDEMSTNQFHLKVAPEFYMAYVVSRSEQKNCGYKIFGDVSSVNEGDVLEFINGMSGDVFVETLYNGKLTVSVVDNKKYAVKPIEIKRVVDEEGYFTFNVFKLLNGHAFVLNKTVEYIQLPDLKGVTDEKKREEIIMGNPATRLTRLAEYFIAHSVYKYEDANGKSMKMFNVVVGYIRKEDELGSVYYLEVPLGRYEAHSPLVKGLMNGLKFTVSGSKAVKNSTAIQIKTKIEEYVNVGVEVDEDNVCEIVSFNLDNDFGMDDFAQESNAFDDVDPALFGEWC